MSLATRAAAAGGVAAGVIVAVLGPTAPAWAATPPTTCGTTAPPSALLSLAGTLTVSPPSTELPTVTLTPPPTGTTTVVVRCDADSSSPVATFPLVVHGDTASAVVPSGMPLLRNGYYTFTATVSGLLPTSTTAHLLLDAPPQAPTDVMALVGPDGHSVNVSWVSGGEPDISGYIVERTGGGGPKVSTHLGATSKSYHDATTVPGVTYTYDVLAERPDIVSGKPLVSIVSNMQVLPIPSLPGANNGNKVGGAQGSHGGGGGGGAPGGGAGATGVLGGGGGSLQIGNGKGVTGSFSKPSLGNSKPLTGAPTLGGFQGTLPYGQNGVALGGQPNASRSTSPAKEDGPHGGYPVWAIALAVLLLAAAGSLFALRRRIAKEKPALESVQPQRRPGDRGR